MSYKTDSDKGFKLLHCLSPPIIVINDPFQIDSSFVRQFKEDGYSVLDTTEMNQEKIKSYLDSRKSRFDHQTLIIFVRINDPERLNQLLPEEYQIFTLVILYPNDNKKYRDLLKQQIANDSFKPESNAEIEELVKEIKKETDDIKLNNLANKLTAKMISSNKEIYQKFLNYFEEKFLTILI